MSNYAEMLILQPIRFNSDIQLMPILIPCNIIKTF